MAKLTRLPADDPGLRDRHILALPPDVAEDEVEVLAVSRFANARWEERPQDTLQPRGIIGPMTAALGIRAVGSATIPTRTLRLARLSTLNGPFRMETGDAVSLGLPTTATLAYVLVCPRERGEKPYPGGDRDGLKRAFPHGMPIREEERVLQWMVAAARRLGGSVRTGENGIVLTPDVDSAIDLTVLSDSWLEPAEALAVVQSVLPRARLSEATSTWTGPAAGVGRDAGGRPGWVAEAGGRGLSAALERYGVDDEAERQRLMDEASAYDELMLAVPPVPEAYGVLVDLGHDGTLSVEAGVETALPPLMRDLPWTRDGVVAYRVHWEPPFIEELEAERPSFEHRVARSRAAPLVQAVARVVHAAIGGEIADEADFLVDPEDV
ncbi:hypothetical protein ASD16_15825 [Cellulomonas sp. Root485]|uniref:hypothetical protein n=1 Tax=Cellulomonas sp. Root485 TaxID=1736546 RepID=UPI0006F621D9|nr:hypothetical protein [Cellulomonas sp. Root485]KQY22106.1 hypothetical protein ASD16_15825 [Cellulomonas sp. Root485]